MRQLYDSIYPRGPYRRIPPHYPHALTLAVALGLAGAFTLILWRPIPRLWAAWLPPASNNVYVPLVAVPLHTPCPAAPAVSRPDAVPSWGAPIAAAPAGEAVWVTNPDSGSVTLLHPLMLEKEAEIPLGGEPWSLALAPNGQRLYVVDRAGGALLVVDTAARTPCARIEVGPEPGHVALSPDGRKVYVTVTHAGEVAVVDAVTLAVTGRIPVLPMPFAVAVTDDGDGDNTDERIYVTHLTAFPHAGGAEATDDGREGRVTVLDAATNTMRSTITLAANVNGFPNLLAGIALAGERAWLPHMRAAPGLPRGLTTTLFAAVSALDLERDVDDASAYLALNDQEIFGSPVNNPAAAIPARDGQTLYIVLAGSNLVEVVDVSTPAMPRLVKFLPVGRNPRGLALSGDGRQAFVMNYLSRSVTVLDLQALDMIAEVPVTGETLAADVLAGKILFNNAADPRLSQGGWIACASCHPDGGTDGVTWMFPDGPRQTPPLWNAAQTRPWHWSAALDEGQDVEETIQLIQHGFGLAPGTDPPLLGAANAGRSPDLDALAAFLERGIRPPNLYSVTSDRYSAISSRYPAISDPNTGYQPWETEGRLSLGIDTAEGRTVFKAAGCVVCHGGPHWTASALPGAIGTLDPDNNGMVDQVLRDVGTLNPQDVRGQAGFDPPSLLGVGLTAPYLHDGSMPTLEALLRSGHPDPLGSGNGLSDEEIAVLIRFLHAIGPDTVPITAP